MTLASIAEILLNSISPASEVSRNERSRASICFKPSAKASNPLVDIARDVVTSGDLLVQETILEYLLVHGLQDCAIRAEEDTPLLRHFRGNAQLATVYIDPIDGTLTYSLGCPRWEEQATAAGYSPQVLADVRNDTDQRFYGIVLGVFVPGSGISAVCALPELSITYHSGQGLSYRNGIPIRIPAPPRATKVAIGRRLLDRDGRASTPFALAGLDVRPFNGSSPGILWQLLEGTCTCYASVQCAYDMQLASVIASNAGCLASNRSGGALALNLEEAVDSIVLASTEDEKDRICDVMLQF